MARCCRRAGDGESTGRRQAVGQRASDQAVGRGPGVRDAAGPAGGRDLSLRLPRRVEPGWSGGRPRSAGVRAGDRFDRRRFHPAVTREEAVMLFRWNTFAAVVMALTVFAPSGRAQPIRNGPIYGGPVYGGGPSYYSGAYSQP